MRSPSLSFENIAAVLAALGTSAVLAACTKADSAAVHSDQAQSSASAQNAVQDPERKGKDEPTPMATAAASAVPIGRSTPPPGTPVGGSARKMDKNGQASCGAGTCTGDLKKK